MNGWIHRLTGIVLVILLAGTPELYAAVLGQQPDTGTQQPASNPAATPQQNGAQANSQPLPAQNSGASADLKEFPDTPSASRFKQSAPATTAPPGFLAQIAQQQNPSMQPDPQRHQDSQAQQNSEMQKNPGPPQNSPPQQPPQNSQRPVGAAAAQIGPTTGGAASKPAGAALAPAKQRQSRSLLLRLGLVAGVGIGLGTVWALSQASPSRPPGAH